MNYLNNKIIWITGASSGTGEALVHEFAKNDCRLIISARREKELERVKKKTGLNDDDCFVLPMDLENYKEMPSLVEKVVSRFGKVDILINNAGLSQRSLIVDTDLSVDEKLMKVNYLGTVALSKAILPSFIKQNSGHFVTVTSIMGRWLTL